MLLKACGNNFGGALGRAGNVTLLDRLGFALEAPPRASVRSDAVRAELAEFDDRLGVWTGGR